MRNPEPFRRDSYRNPRGVQEDPGRDGYGLRDGKGKGFTSKEVEAKETKSPSPNPNPNPQGGILAPPSDTAARVYLILDGGLASLLENDHGRPWPLPSRRAIRESLENFDHDLCLKAAKEAREIVQAQDRAPNITGLYLKKLEDLNSVRAVVRDSLGSAA